MAKPRVSDLDHGIRGEGIVKTYDRSLRHLRDIGIFHANSILKSRIDLGCVLEIGPGPGYMGLDWLKKTEDTTLKGLDISQEMVALATKNAKDHGLDSRAEYLVGDASNIPFRDGYFDAVFSTNTLHEWISPEVVFDEIHRVLRPGGKYFISDLRRDMNPITRWFIVYCQPKGPKEYREGLVRSINSAYTLSEVGAIMAKTQLKDWKAEQTSSQIIILGRSTFNGPK
jgi:ubiquinone/menaquinone biosynthesis C-methylase UbiE